MKQIAYLAGAALLAIVCRVEVAMAIEQPEYALIDSEGTVEFRSYQPMVVARVLVETSFESAGNAGFRPLAGYIFGGNQGETKIAMTAPVTQEKAESTTDSYWLSFTMPGSYNLGTLPAPNDPDVELIELPSRVMAVLPYRGGWSESKFREHERRLRELLSDHPDWAASGEAVWARYNSPMMPAFMRSNEVHIPVVPRAGF